MEEYKIRLLVKRDCRKAAALRLAEQDWGFLSAMDISFHAEILKGTCASKWGFGLVCVGEGEKIIGMAYAATNLERYYRSIIFRRGFMLAILAFITVLKKPRLITGLFQYLLYPSQKPFMKNEAEWLTMVVDREQRNKGIAHAMLTALIEEYEKRGVKKFRSTVMARNVKSCRLHETKGFRLLGSFILCGDSVNVYEYDILKAL